MKLKKGILLTTLTLFMVAMLSSFATTKAATGSKYLNLKMLRSSGYGYQLANSRKNVWKIYERGGYGETIYCLKGGPGFGSTDFFSGSPQETEYTRYYDMKDPDNIPSTYRTALPNVNSNTYKALLWLLDHCYIAPKTNASTEQEQQAEEFRQILLDAAIDYATDSAHPYPNIQEDGYEFELLTDDDIDAVQQLAVWYFTNPSGDYHVNSFDFWLNTVAGNNSSEYKSLSDRTYFGNEGWDRANACQALFDYLTKTAAEQAESYEITTGTITIAPVQIANTTATIQTVGSRMVIGPYRLQENQNTNYSLTVNVKDGNNATISDVILLDNNQNAAREGTTIKDFAGQNFYISIPASTNASKITLSINGSYFLTTATYWSVANPTTSDQPVAIIEKTEKTFADEKIITNTPEKVFDLALRKYITKLNGTAVSNTRTPVIDQSTLTSGTTATYKHRKDPLVVEHNNKVIYNLTVYNEGEKAGRATEIIDQLPTGLELITEGTVTSTNKGNTYTIHYDKTTNRVTLSTTGTNNLNAYNGTTLDSDTIELECKVTATAGADNTILTNIAWISKEYDAEANKTITTTRGEDRDSEPGTVPTINGTTIKKDNMSNYTGNGNKADLTDPTYYYKGQQDDDDFEKLVLVGKPFDLSLRKFITSVSHNGTTTNYNREPQVDVTNLKNGTYTTASYKHPKNPILVELGDIVTYTIRVYNEGQRDGYVTEITDHLPAQLEFINDEFNTITNGWTVSSDGRTVKTKIVKDELLDAYHNGDTLDYVEVQIHCKVKSYLAKPITNIAEITGFSDTEGNSYGSTTKPLIDRDSDGKGVTLPTDETLPEYKGHGDNKSDLTDANYYYKGQQDDDDFEKIILKQFDLALRKFITSIAGVPVTDREPQITSEELAKLTRGQTTTAEKVHPKNALAVKTGDKVIYTIRVYNEGEINGYATEITDHLPTGLKFIPSAESKINQDNGWSNPSGDGKTIVSKALQGKLISAFNGTDLKYEDLQIECQVVATVTEDDQILKNIAEITEHQDEYGNKEIPDRDSKPKDIKDLDKWQPGQDDEDYEPLVLEGKYFDLSLRKFISSVSHNGTIKNYDRAPVVDVTALKDGGKTTATYQHPKTPVSVDLGDEVVYTIRVYNEGQIDAHVTEIKDHLPKQLEFIVNDDLNAKYGWRVSSDGRTVTTDITSPSTTNSANRDTIYQDRTTTADKVLLTAFNGGDTLDYIDVQIKCKVRQDSNLFEKITNIAEITGFTDSNGNTVKDRDSQEKNVDLPSDENLPGYKDTEIDRGDKYIPGQQDDDDFEKLVLQRFDLALRKFITGVNDKEIINRAPVFTKISNTQYKYEHTKEPVEVANGNTVIYTLRIFNEGNVAGYAQEVKDNLPNGIEFLPDNEINKQYRWTMYKADGTQTTNVSEATYVQTDYLSKEQESEASKNLIKAFNPETMTMPDYKDVKIAFKVTEPNTSNRIIINTAEIAEDADEKGKPIDDIDSTPNNNKDGEDDIDIEKIKVKYFDLSLRKWVTESIVTYNGKTTTTKTGHKAEDEPEAPAKVEIRGSRVDKTTVKFKFNIKVTNEGEIEGYAKELKDYIPAGLKFIASDNPQWKTTDKANEVVTDQLKDTLLKPGESATVSITLTWINNKNNMGEKVNWAEISKDYNEYNSPDIDSTPNNNQKGEDDIDYAPVILSVVTGSAPTYIALVFSSLGILTAGVVLIKKFVI